MELYLEIMFSRSELSRAERELIAVVVSVLNECNYCQIHHAEALNHYWKNDEKISLLKKDFRQAGLTGREMKLCEYAQSLTLYPAKANETDITEPLKNAGLNDSTILDATLVVAYFNFVNRIVSGLRVEIESDLGAGYNY